MVNDWIMAITMKMKQAHNSGKFEPRVIVSKNSEQRVDIFLGRCPKIVADFSTATAYGSCALPLT